MHLKTPLKKTAKGGVVTKIKKYNKAQLKQGRGGRAHMSHLEKNKTKDPAKLIKLLCFKANDNHLGNIY